MSEKFNDLVNVMERLRAPGGCPWDREQTYESLAPYLLEETYEAFDAIQEAAETGETANLSDELGDVLLQVVFHSTIAKEKGDFTIDDVAEGITQKLILRHPHVFEDKTLATADDVLDNWDELKKAEQKARGKEFDSSGSILDEVPVAFPALIEGNKITKKAAKVGFDWENADQVFEKINEETLELRDAIAGEDRSGIEEEIGDLLFAVVNLARKLGVEPENALKKTNRKFRKRFRFIEDELKEQKQSFDDVDLAGLDSLWDKAKSANL
ncbi:MAG: nucleoside triphosphate pyrophosphohydrolase [Acidobacteria bacterium]|nr:nucleoside triphosphate pyrophosphohydrolase [Acidobacteriota bacterium]